MHVCGTTSTNPLSVLASKTLIGHAEPASGLLGMSYAVGTLRSHQAPPIIHLRALNPYVLQQLQGKSVCLPRQHAPLRSSTQRAVVGVSAFAFQVRCYHLPIAVSSSSLAPCRRGPMHMCSFKPLQRCWIQPQHPCTLPTPSATGHPHHRQHC